MLLPTQWRHQNCLRHNSLTAEMRQWLLTPGSLSQRLREESRIAFEVRVTFQGEQKPRYEEAIFLNINPHKKVIVREVELLCDKEVYVIARSIFPKITLVDKGIQLHNLGDKPLSEILYADPSLQRSDFEVAALKNDHPDYIRAKKSLAFAAPVLWARRSVFYWHKKPLLVTEIFLPR